MKNIILGTANFGKKYGKIYKKKIPFKEIKKILFFCKKKKINFLDTAFFYKNNGILKKLNLKNFNIITKISLSDIKNKNRLSQEVDNSIKKFIKLLKLKNLYAVLFHNVNDLDSILGKKLYITLRKLKKQKKIKKIGISVYNKKEIDKACKKFKFNIIQCPISIFDRRLVERNYLKKFKKKGIEIHARSIFLQGLLISEKKLIIKKFYHWKTNFEKWEEWNKKNKTKQLNTCLSYVNSLKYIDKFIVGVNSLKQMKEIFRSLKKNKEKINYPSFCKDENLLDPRKWQTNL